MFEKADVEKKGTLTYSQFKDSFKTLKYDVTEDDILVLLALADEDEEERIMIKEFLPFCVNMIRTFYRRNLRGDNMPIKQDALKLVYQKEITKSE